ncbi:GumC family protein [Planctomycetaceae bacterium SH139]
MTPPNTNHPEDEPEFEESWLATGRISRRDKPAPRTLVQPQQAALVASPIQREGAADEESVGFNLAAYLEIPFVHKRLIIGCLLLAIVLGWMAILVWPRKYYSEAKLLIRVGRESVSLDPTATTSQTLMLQKTQEEEVNSVLEVLGSRQLAEQVVAQVGVDAILDGYLPSDDTTPPSAFKAATTNLKRFASDTLHNVLLAAGIKDDISDQELAVLTLQNNLQVASPKKSTVVGIRAETKSPQLARAIVESLTELFLREHVRVSATEGSQDFFLEQADEAEKLLNILADRRSTMLQDQKIASISSKQAALTAQIAEIDRDLLVARSSLEQYEAEIEDILEKANTTEEEIVATKQQQIDATWSSMRNRLYELEMQERQLAAKYNDGHPKLNQVREQLKGAQAILSKVESERENQSMTPNPARVRLLEEMQRKQTSVVGLQSLINERERQRLETQLEIDKLLEFELKISELDREISLAESSLRLLRDKQEEARVIDQLQSNQISNVGVFQSASLIERAFSPNKKLLLASFTMLGLFGGFALAFVRELSTTTIRRPDHLLAGLSKPIIATIPNTSLLSSPSSIRSFDTSSQIGEICRGILADVMLSKSSRFPNQVRGLSMGVLGVHDGCGASAVAAALALTASEDAGLKTTLIDADGKRRTTSETFGLHEAPGLAELLAGKASPDDCLQHDGQRQLGLICSSLSRGLSSLTQNPAAVAEALIEFGGDLDLLIFDLPAANRAEQSIMLAKQLDYLLVVVEAEKTECPHAERIIRRLEEHGAKVTGVILNKTRNHLPRVLSRLLLS